MEHTTPATSPATESVRGAQRNYTELYPVKEVFSATLEETKYPIRQAYTKQTWNHPKLILQKLGRPCYRAHMAIKNTLSYLKSAG
uniref:Uncharacterized protein n=1 Tax=Megaselia scalaris TaxID=36166 RepID=T1GHP0_MEGSC